MARIPHNPNTADLDVRRRVHNRYENLNIINDFAVAFWFLAGSICFYADVRFLGTWMFVLGSVQMMMGAILRVIHKRHIKRLDSVY